MDLGTAFLLAFGGPVAGALLLLIGGLLIWRASGGWQAAGYAMLLVGAGLIVLGVSIYVGLAQVNWSL